MTQVGSVFSEVLLTGYVLPQGESQTPIRGAVSAVTIAALRKGLHDCAHCEEHCQSLKAFASGTSRKRLPVSAKIAFASAAPTGGTPGSPTPLGGSVESTMSVWMR